ncbi:uncharacterized protein DS421_5g170320 [Arachis hypogaea]|nr:uncharacterized protein DS421_5g170320 [Arachis hypogaea]
MIYFNARIFAFFSEFRFVFPTKLFLRAVFSWEFVPRRSSYLWISQFSAQIQHLRFL